MLTTEAVRQSEPSLSVLIGVVDRAHRVVRTAVVYNMLRVLNPFDAVTPFWGRMSWN